MAAKKKEQWPHCIPTQNHELNQIHYGVIMAEQIGPHGWAIELENDEHQQADIEARAKVFCDTNIDVVRALQSRVEWYQRQGAGQELLLLAQILHNTVNAILQLRCVVADKES